MCVFVSSHCQKLLRLAALQSSLICFDFTKWDKGYS